MTWIRLDDNFPDHPKVLGLSDAAFRLFVQSLCYSARYMTDGTIPARLGGNAVTNMAEIKGTASEELVKVGLWIDVGGSYEIHDYLEYNPSRKDIEHSRAAVAARVRRYRERPNAVTNAVTNARSNAVTNGKETASPYPYPEEQDLLFDRFWKAYPRTGSKIGARKKFEAALKRGVDPEAIIAGAERHRDDPNREPEFTKLPTTWLNNGCWEDDPLPPRGGSPGLGPLGRDL